MEISSNGRKPVITIHDMTKVYQMGEHQVHALNGVSLDIYEGDFVSIMGPSGSGKIYLDEHVGGTGSAHQRHVFAGWDGRQSFER